MHIPPYHKKALWRFVLIGAFFGSIIAYCIFIFMYGQLYEQLIEENLTLQSEITELKSQNKALLEDKEHLDEQHSELSTVDKIEIIILNDEQLRLDRLIVHQLEQLIKNDISQDVIGKNITTLSENDTLLISTIENKAYKIDDFTYYFEVRRLTVAQTLKLSLQAKLSN